MDSVPASTPSLSSSSSSHLEFSPTRRSATSAPPNSRTNSQQMPIFGVRRSYLPFTINKFRMFEARYKYMMAHMTDANNRRKTLAYIPHTASDCNTVPVGSIALEAHVVMSKKMSDKTWTVVVMFGQRIRITASWFDDQIPTLQYCSSVGFVDKHVRESMGSPSFALDLDTVWNRIELIRVHYRASGIFPRALLQNEPMQDDFGLDAHWISVWSLWACAIIIVGNGGDIAFGDAQRILLTQDVSARLQFLTVFCDELKKMDIICSCCAPQHVLVSNDECSSLDEEENGLTGNHMHF